jgi:adenylate cyclase
MARVAQPQVVKIVKATVLFADLRGYTALAERMGPAEVLSRLHQFFGVLLGVVEDHGGEVFHVAGDSLMAGFARRRRGSSGGRAALASGQAMLSRFAVLSEQWHRDIGVATALGVGVHFGDVALGLLGPPRHEAWTLVGDTVNVAARLCDRARGGEVLFSAAVLNSIHSCARKPAHSMWWGDKSAISVEPVPYRQLPSFALRGRSAPVEIWCWPAKERVWT